MYELKKIGKIFTSKFVGTGPSSYKKRIYLAAVSQSLRNTSLEREVVTVVETGVPTYQRNRCLQQTERWYPPARTPR